MIVGISVMRTRSWVVVSRSRTVTFLSVNESWSTVIQYGVPISSIRAYRRPIVPLSS
jgi:hypothetical protein